MGRLNEIAICLKDFHNGQLLVRLIALLIAPDFSGVLIVPLLGYTNRVYGYHNV